jgi:hypothetical protein
MQLRRCAWRLGATGRTQHQHPEEVSTAVPERAFLERLAVPHHEKHLENELDACAIRVLSENVVRMLCRAALR